MKRFALIRFVVFVLAAHALSSSAADGDAAATVAAGYQSQATAAVLSHVVVPRALSGREWVEYRLAVQPNGRIDSVHLLRSSGSRQWEFATALGLANTIALPKTADGRMPGELELRLESAAANGLPAPRAAAAASRGT